MSRIQFIHECHINAVKYEGDSQDEEGNITPNTGRIVDESELPESWVAGAIREKFVRRLPAAGSGTNSAETGKPATDQTVLNPVLDPKQETGTGSSPAVSPAAVTPPGVPADVADALKSALS